MYRYDKLDKARKCPANETECALSLAYYKWRRHPDFYGFTVQYHINADIAYAIYQYYHATGDKDFL